MQKRAFLGSLSLCFVLILSVCGFVTNGTAKDALIFYAVNYPPYDIEKHPSGMKGFDVEVVEAAFASVGVNIEVKFRPWKRIMSEVETGKATGAVTCSDVPARRSWVYLSDKLSVTRLAIVDRDHLATVDAPRHLVFILTRRHTGITFDATFSIT